MYGHVISAPAHGGGSWAVAVATGVGPGGVPSQVAWWLFGLSLFGPLSLPCPEVEVFLAAPSPFPSPYC